MQLRNIEAKTRNQDIAFSYDETGDNILMLGLPGTGKTFLALYFALQDIDDNMYDRITIVRSVVATRDMGFLPGSVEEKASVFELPYIGAVNELYGRGDAYDILKKKKVIEFSTTSFIRGITLDNTVVIIDEFQNMSSQELHSIITRLGENSRLIICGDVGQDDLTSERYNEKSGAAEMIRILQSMDCISIIEFNVDDIVRSGFVKSYIIAKNKLEKQRITNIPAPPAPRLIREIM